MWFRYIVGWNEYIWQGTMRLTDAALRAAKGRETIYKISDGEGLYVSVLPTGSKVFRYDFRLGKSATLTLGRYDPERRGKDATAREPELLEFGDTGLTIAEARVLHQRAKRRVQDGHDPRKADSGSFRSAAEGWHTEGEKHRREGTQKLYRRMLDNYVLPALGDRDMIDIKRSDVLALCREILHRKAKPGDRRKGGLAPARMAREVVSMIYDYINGENDNPILNPARDIRPDRKIAPRKPPSKRRLPVGEIGAFLRALDAVATPIDLPRANVLKLILMGLGRKQEVIGGQWPEVDLTKAEWRIPAERMKEGREHIVPLSKQAVRLLKSMERGGDAMFPGVDGKLMDHGAPNKLLTRLVKAAEVTHIGPHDIRRTASTILNDAGADRDDVDRCLAHIVGSATSRVYDAAERLAERRKLLQQWCDALDGWRTEKLSGLPVLG